MSESLGSATWSPGCQLRFNSSSGKWPSAQPWRSSGDSAGLRLNFTSGRRLGAAAGQPQLSESQMLTRATPVEVVQDEGL